MARQSAVFSALKMHRKHQGERFIGIVLLPGHRPPAKSRESINAFMDEDRIGSATRCICTADGGSIVSLRMVR